MDYAERGQENCSIRILLQEKYAALLEMCGCGAIQDNRDIISIIRNVISEFVKQCHTPAIWCYGTHTKMLMADFIFELKKVRYIIDNGMENSVDGGFEIINESKITEKNIDGIIISSKIYKDEIIANLNADDRHISYLDIYAELEKAGFQIEGTYYEARHPYAKYCKLNKLQRDMADESKKETHHEILVKIIEKYIEIKDFKSAIFYTEKLIAFSEDLEKAWGKRLLEKLSDIYRTQLEAMGQIDDNSVLMLCIDGLRRKEVTDEHMRNLSGFLRNSTYYYSNAYSMSTSTYESLLPAYSENADLRTRYYEKNGVPEYQCRFVNEAKRQNRKICFYTDGVRYVEDADIAVKTYWQTATEKLWDFLMDSVEEDKGLFYIHILYESHYSYPNPYTREEIIAEGTSIFFDYLEKNGGQIRTDYNRQQKDALRYLDDVVVPLIEKLSCRMVLYADHGNILIDQGTEIGYVESTKYTFHEDLIQIPFAVKSPEMQPGRDGRLVSLMDLNSVIIALMNREEVTVEDKTAVKVLRSEIYNPDFRYLYQRTGNEHGLLAFEVFLFSEGYKLAVYADGVLELYFTETDSSVEDIVTKRRLLDMVRNQITVCALGQIRVE